MSPGEEMGTENVLIIGGRLTNSGFNNSLFLCAIEKTKSNDKIFIESRVIKWKKYQHLEANTVSFQIFINIHLNTKVWSIQMRKQRSKRKNVLLKKIKSNTQYKKSSKSQTDGEKGTELTTQLGHDFLPYYE